ncbi:MAG: 6-carboxytetrahydropterin synthase [Spirochaetota bacterium]
MFTTGVQRPLNARHHLPTEEGPEAQDHQLPYVVEWQVRVPALDAKGYGTDIAWMECNLEAILGEIDGVLLNKLPAFSARLPSLENLCVYLWERCAATGVAGKVGIADKVGSGMGIKIWQAAGTPDPALTSEAHSCLGPMASSLEPLGHLDPDALVRLLHGADIFLHPSGQGTFCLSVFEAALAGCRIVAHAIGGVPEAVHLAKLLRRQLGLPPAAFGVTLASVLVVLWPGLGGVMLVAASLGGPPLILWGLRIAAAEHFLSLRGVLLRPANMITLVRLVLGVLAGLLSGLLSGLHGSAGMAGYGPSAVIMAVLVCLWVCWPSPSPPKASCACKSLWPSVRRGIWRDCCIPSWCSSAYLAGRPQPGCPDLSFEFLPQGLQAALDRLEHLEVPGVYEYNVSMVETLRFVSDSWVDAAQVSSFISGPGPRGRSGDVYARLRRL